MKGEELEGEGEGNRWERGGGREVKGDEREGRDLATVFSGEGTVWRS